MTEPLFAGTYPSDKDFWVPAELAAQHPARYGDVFAVSADMGLLDSKGRPWRAVMAVHPSCEMGTKPATAGVQVVRVHLLREVSQGQRAQVQAGFREQGGGVRPARVNMVYMAAIPSSEKLNEDLYADLGETARVSAEQLIAAGRLAAMSHDARLAVLRRDIYFRYRWLLPLQQVLRLEQGRISADAHSVGPRPQWAPTTAGA